MAPVMVAVESVIGSSLTVSRWSRRLAERIEERGGHDRERACDAQAPTSGCAPVSTPTPSRPRAIPTTRRPVARSLWASQIARIATKSGTVAFAIAATPSRCASGPRRSA